MSQRPEAVLPLGGGSIGVTGWTRFLVEEYLDGYIREGGAAVKLAVCGDPEVARRLDAEVGVAADRRGYVVVRVDAAEVRIHLVEQLFFAVARSLDWPAVARGLVRAGYDAAGFPVPAELPEVTVRRVAAHHDCDERELYRSVRRTLEHSLLADEQLARELRMALLRLAQAELGSGDVEPAEAAAVLEWLRGDLRRIVAVRPCRIYRRIARYNARHLLVSIGPLLVRAGYPGLVVLLDLERLAEARRPPLAERRGVYYTKAAVLDAYEVLRQLVDQTDQLRSTLVLAELPPALVLDEVRGLPAYTALELRVADEVRDRRRPNPFAALVRLETRLEAVP